MGYKKIHKRLNIYKKKFHEILNIYKRKSLEKKNKNHWLRQKFWIQNSK